ncbi:MAG TPA: protein-methionine-sulfoxide reductase heme-binding subunit MsrQ [Polyangiaceae bacterium]
MAQRRLPWLGPAVIAGSLVPFASLAHRALAHRLGANPVATALNQLGLLALVFLIASLSCTPLKIALGWTWPVRVRRTLGLFCFFTALCHFLVYFCLDQAFSLAAFLADVEKRPFISLGFTALLLLVPLALTSTKRSVTRLGFRAWQRLHQLAYLVGVLAVVHFYLRVKADHTEPLLYAAILGFGFGLRIVAAWQAAQNTRRRALARAGRSG